jgi:hypothetical protein
VAGFPVSDEKPPERRQCESKRNIKKPHYSRISKNRTVAGIRYSRGAREAIATSVKVAGICTSDVKAEELDSPLAGGGAGVVGG